VHSAASVRVVPLCKVCVLHLGQLPKLGVCRQSAGALARCALSCMAPGMLLLGPKVCSLWPAPLLPSSTCVLLLLLSPAYVLLQCRLTFFADIVDHARCAALLWLLTPTATQLIELITAGGVRTSGCRTCRLISGCCVLCVVVLHPMNTP
jgi:hypothetical protein